MLKSHRVSYVPTSITAITSNPILLVYHFYRNEPALQISWRNLSSFIHSLIYISEFLKFVGSRGQKIMRSANNVGNPGPCVRQTFLNDVFIFFSGSRKRRSYCKYRNKFGQLWIRNRIEYVIFYLFLANIIGNCHENKYVWIYCDA